MPDRDRVGTLTRPGTPVGPEGAQRVTGGHRGGAVRATRAGRPPERPAPRPDPAPREEPAPLESLLDGDDATALGAAEHADFAEYVRVRGPHLAGVARLLVDDRAVAEDLVQTVLVKALASWPRIRRSADVDAYLRKALVNTRNSWWWRHRRELPSAELPDSPVADHGDGVAEQERLAAALARLPRGQRTAVVLRYYADLSESQVAEAMGCSIGTVRSQTARGVAALRDAFGAPRAPGRARGRTGAR